MSESALVTMPDSLREYVNEVISITRETPLLGARPPNGKSWTEVLLTKSLTADPSSQGVRLGIQMQPFDMEQVTLFQTTNIHHAACLHTKVAATVGLGFKQDVHEGGGNPAATLSPDATGTAQIGNVQAPIGPPPDEAVAGLSPMPGMPGMTNVGLPQDRLLSKVDEILNPLCTISWADVLNSVCEDYWQVGNGYIEVVRVGTTIAGIHYIPAHRVQIFIENSKYDFHYIVRNENGAVRRFARFGDKDSFLQRYGQNTVLPTIPDTSSGTAPTAENTSEIIHLRRPTSLSRWYGFPDWLACVSYIELSQCLTQHKYDFFLNRGVPEFMLFITGQKLSKEDWTKVENAMRANIGLGNSHKSFALNLENENIKITLEKLAMVNSTDEQFSTTGEAIALGIVTAHRVPPLLAGIQIPGKLGATNELPNALAGFQALVVGPAQMIFSQTLGTTLGDKGSGLGLQRSDFTFYRILDEIDIQKLDTMARIRQPIQTATEPNGAPRNLSAGVKS